MIYWNGKDIIGMFIIVLILFVIALRALYSWIVEKYRIYNSPQEFIKREIRKILKNNPHIKVRYYFDYYTTHYICIDTSETLESLYKDKIIQKFDMKFIHKFPNELLSFVLLEDFLEFGLYEKLIYEN